MVSCDARYHMIFSLPVDRDGSGSGFGVWKVQAGFYRIWEASWPVFFGFMLFPFSFIIFLFFKRCWEISKNVLVFKCSFQIQESSCFLKNCLFFFKKIIISKYVHVFKKITDQKLFGNLKTCLHFFKIVGHFKECSCF